MTSLALYITIAFVIFQLYFFKETWTNRGRFQNFFKKKKNYSTFQEESGNEAIIQLSKVGLKDSDLNNLIEEINHYIRKTKGTTDFSVIQNKVERKLNMRYDQSTVFLSFPTYLGLMGTFAGVFLGIWMFLSGFDEIEGITDESLTNLLHGVMVSMFTSLSGLIMTTLNNGKAGYARKKVEEDKNEFYDFVQTELMPTLDVSMVAAITSLHETVDRFEPAFNNVITRFQTTFDSCTRAFGDNFEQNVKAVAGAVEVMGKNMDKVNKNIELQERLISTLKSSEVARGMEKYVEAAEHFVSITRSLDKFEEARRMMLAAAQEAINLQNQYSESLKIPREVAVRVNQILDRIKEFEASVNRLGGQLDRREILGNEVVNKIQEQIKGIQKKGKIADDYLGIADGKLEDLFKEQTAVIDKMNKRYRDAIESHIEGFEKMLAKQTEELQRRHDEFMRAMEERLSIEEVQKDFSNLRKLNEIFNELRELSRGSVKSDELGTRLAKIEGDLTKLSEIMKKVEEKAGSRRGLFGFGN